MVIHLSWSGGLLLLQGVLLLPPFSFVDFPAFFFFFFLILPDYQVEMSLMRELASNGEDHMVKAQEWEDSRTTQNWNNSAQLPSGSCLNYMNPVIWPTPEHGCHPHTAVEASLQQLFP